LTGFPRPTTSEQSVKPRQWNHRARNSLTFFPDNQRKIFRHCVEARKSVFLGHPDSVWILVPGLRRPQFRWGTFRWQNQSILVVRRVRTNSPQDNVRADEPRGLDRLSIGLGLLHQSDRKSVISSTPIQFTRSFPGLLHNTNHPPKWAPHIEEVWRSGGKGKLS
jgi:hypothetical protein